MIGNTVAIDNQTQSPITASKDMINQQTHHNRPIMIGGTVSRNQQKYTSLLYGIFLPIPSIIAI